MSNRNEVIEKIKKLLAISNNRGATENEALQAALIAQRYIAEYDVQDFELSDNPEHIIEVETDFIFHAWRDWLANAIADNFRCKTYICAKYSNGSTRRRKSVVFFGYKHDAQAAKFVFEYLYKVGNRLANDAAHDLPKQYKRHAYQSFVTGFVDGVRSELEKQSQALMLKVPLAVSEAFDEKSRNLKRGQSTQRFYEMKSYQQDGFSAGRDAIQSRRINTGNEFLLSE